MESLCLLFFVLMFTTCFVLWYYEKRKKPKENRIVAKLTMKAIIRWEQLNQKAFSALNYDNENETISLLYLCKHPAGDISLDEFKNSLTESSLKQMVSDFERQISLVSQFQAKAKKKEGEKEKSKENNEQPHVFIKDTVAMLVMNGLDVNFALNDMELCDLPVFLQAYDELKKEKLTSQRLWAFMLLQPYLSKGTQPKDIYPFPWEAEADSISEDELEARKNEFKIFQKTGLNK